MNTVDLGGKLTMEPVGPSAAARLRHRAPVFVRLISARAGVFVRYRIEAEGSVRECAIGAVGLVKDRDVQADLSGLLTEHRPACALAPVKCSQDRRYQSSRSFSQA